MTDELFQDLLKVEGINFRGFGVVPKYVMFDIDLTLEAKAIYAYFCSFTGSGNTAFPGRDKILLDLQMSKKAYYHHFNLLLLQGYITVETQLAKGLKSRNIYTVVSKPKKFLDYQSNPKKEEKYNVIRCSGLKKLGYGTIPKAVMQDQRLTIKSKGIYAFLSCLTGSGDTAFPLINDMTYFLQITKTTYYKHYQMLLDFNYVTTVQRHIDGVLRSNEYVLNELPDIEAETEVKKSKKVIKTTASEPDEQFKFDQRPKKEDTVKEDAVKPKKGGSSLKNQRFDQRPKKEDTVKEDTVKEDTKINNIDHQQSLQSISPSILKSTGTEGMKNTVSDSAINIKMSSDNSINSAQTEVPVHKATNNNPASATNDRTSSESLASLANRAQIEVTVHEATDYNNVCENYNATPKAEQDEYTHSVFCLFNESLIDMLSSEQIMVLNRQKVSSDMINNKFAQCLNNDQLHNNSFDTQSLIELASADYIKGSQLNIERGTKIKNPLQYMKSCIWNALLVGKNGLLKPNQASNNNGASQQNQKNAPKNRFVNFSQREIDFADLERKERELLKEHM